MAVSKTLLFVDEEQFVHKALKRSFRNMRSEWDMRFVNNPVEALEALAQKPADVLITETVFSGHSGFDLLNEIRERYPQIVRIILSGYANQDVILKSVDLAHQYLSKPCEDGDLKAAISKAFFMKYLLEEEALKQLVSRIDSLPSLPKIYVELVDALKSEKTSIKIVGSIVSKDMGLTAKLLKLINSAFFGLPQKVSTPTQAVSLLGLDLVRAFVLTSGAFDHFRNRKFKGFSMESMWEHAMTTAAMSKIIAQEAGLDLNEAENAFMSGLLHDVGKLLIATYLPSSFAAILEDMKNHAVTMAAAEQSVIGTTHAAIGAYLLGLWGLPEHMVESAAFHHTPGVDTPGVLTPLIINHIANAFANAGSNLSDPDYALEGLDERVVQQVGLSALIPSWRKVCADSLDKL